MILRVIILGAVTQAGAVLQPASTSAEVFIRNLYQREAHGTYADETAFAGRKGAEAIYSPALLALIRRDRARTPKGDLGKLDYDPICGCQDSVGISVNAIHLVSTSESHINALVTLRFSGSAQQQLRLKLVLTPQGWRVDDVDGPTGYLPLRSLLTSTK